jgi:hypothetical protein
MTLRERIDTLLTKKLMNSEILTDVWWLGMSVISVTTKKILKGQIERIGA